MNRRELKRSIGLGLLGGFCFGVGATLVTFWPSSKSSSEIWESEIRAFELADGTNAPPKNGILFVGSSSIARWTSLHRDFPGYRIIRRGFGGSKIEDVITFADRIVLPYEPRMILLYAGDNDLAGGKTPEQVLDDFKEFVAAVREDLPETRVGFISVKPSLARWHLIHKIRRANRFVRELAEEEPLVTYIDVFTPMLDESGRLKKIYFAEDGLHLSPKGYKLWTAVIRSNLPPKLPPITAGH